MERELQKMLSYLLSLNKQQLRLVTGLFSGRCSQRHHLNIDLQKVPQDRKRNPTILFVNPRLWLGTGRDLWLLQPQQIGVRNSVHQDD
jgi:hypothetical protein